MLFSAQQAENISKVKTAHLSVAYMPNVGHRNVETLQQFSNSKTDKTFIFCGVVYKEPEREKFLKDLAEALQQGHVNYQYYGCFEQPGVYGKAYYKVLSETKWGSITHAVMM